MGQRSRKDLALMPFFLNSYKDLSLLMNLHYFKTERQKAGT